MSSRWGSFAGLLSDVYVALRFPHYRVGLPLRPEARAGSDDRARKGADSRGEERHARPMQLHCTSGEVRGFATRQLSLEG